MKWFLITLAIGLAASDKLDRTYLPPPGAQFSGGILGRHDAPLEPPNHTHSGQRPSIGGHDVSHPTFGINGESVNFGDKISKFPVTTTSYAFSQTTTYPPGEGFETTALPINPVTGLPIQLGQDNLPNGSFQGQGPNFGTNNQPGFDPLGPTAVPENNGSPGYKQFPNQPLNQYPGQNVIPPGGTTPQTPGLVYPGQNQGHLQYPGGPNNAEQEGLVPAVAPDNQRLDQYPGQNVVNPGGVVQIPGGNQGLVQYPGGQTVNEYQGIVPSTGSPISLIPAENQYGVNYDGSQGQIPQGTYTGQPINVPNLAGTQPTQTSFQNRQPINVGGSPSHYPNGNQNYGPAMPTGSENGYQHGSTPSTIPSSYNNGVSSTTPFPGVPSSTSSYPSIGPVYRPERPQAAADRNAIILNYENVRTPNGYSYSFDTSNGIHADENGIVDNGTKAQGSYSYIGDDGKVYSVIYTADENGFQPRGDHLPTPPPIPEAIQRVIEQAARDKAAGIVHDGSYDEEKYGDHKYQGVANHRRPQNQDTNQYGNDQLNGAKDDLIKPIVGIKDVEYDEGVEQDQFKNNLPVIGTTKDTNGKLPTRRPLNQINGKNNSQDIPEGNKRVSGDFDSPKGTFDGNSMPIVEEVINQQNNFGTKKQGSSYGRDSPVSIKNNMPLNEANDSNQNNLTGLKRRGPSSRRPISGGVKDVTEKYPGSNVDVGDAIYSENEGDELYNSEGQDVDSGNSNIDGSVKNMKTNFDSVTSAPIAGNKKQILRKRIKGNGKGPVTTANEYTQNRNGRPQDETSIQEITETAPFSEYIKNDIANQQPTQHNDKGYHYQQPNKKFEQTTFPTRFSPQEVFSTRKPDQRRTEYVEGTTLRPFMTPNVYDKNDRSSQSTPNGYNQNNRNSQSTTRRPFTTVGVTSPMDNSYTDYDVGEDYTNDDDEIDSNRYPAEKGDITSRPYQPSQTTSRPQNLPGGQRIRFNQKGTVTPGRRTENSGTVSPGYTYGPTTQMPSHNYRFGSTEIPRRMKPQQRRPSDTVPNSKTAIGSPVTTQSSSGTRPTDYNYQTTVPKYKYPGTNVGSGYPTTGSYPDFGSMSTTPGVSTPQDYYTSTYGPTHVYPSTTAVPSTYGNRQGPSSQVPSITPGSFQPTQDQSFENGYHYGPPKSGSINLDVPGFFTPTGTSGVFPTSPTGTYQTTYQQHPGGFPSTTLTPGRQGTFITSQPGTAAPETSPTGTYQGNYQNGPSTPDYGTTIVSSTPGGKPIFKYPGSPGAQETTGYEYGPTQTTYSTTNSPSTIGTTPTSFIPSGTTDPSQGYSTTYRPGFQTTKDTFVSGPVDGFGRPITTEQGGSHPGFGHPTQGTTGPVNNLIPNFGGTDQSTTYPAGYDQPRNEEGGSHLGFSNPTQGTTGPVNNLGPNFGRTDQSTTHPSSYDRTRVIGEDFSGPKQPQRYDPKTGYHYK